MTSKELSAWVMALSAVVISAWVAWEAARGLPATVSEAAWKVLWAIGASIVLNIIAVIAGTILVSIAQREAVKDERADERDKAINDRSMRNAYFVLSLGLLAVLFWQAFGLDAVLAPYALFGISMLAGASFAISQIVYYRVG